MNVSTNFTGSKANDYENLQLILKFIELEQVNLFFI